jgi:hypothetical protein
MIYMVEYGLKWTNDIQAEDATSNKLVNWGKF